MAEARRGSKGGPPSWSSEDLVHLHGHSHAVKTEPLKDAPEKAAVNIEALERAFFPRGQGAGADFDSAGLMPSSFSAPNAPILSEGEWELHIMLGGQWSVAGPKSLPSIRLKHFGGEDTRARKSVVVRLAATVASAAKGYENQTHALRVPVAAGDHEDASTTDSNDRNFGGELLSSSPSYLSSIPKAHAAACVFTGFANPGAAEISIDLLDEREGGAAEAPSQEVFGRSVLSPSMLLYSATTGVPYLSPHLPSLGASAEDNISLAGQLVLPVWPASSSPSAAASEGLSAIGFVSLRYMFVSPHAASAAESARLLGALATATATTDLPGPSSSSSSSAVGTLEAGGIPASMSVVAARTTGSTGSTDAAPSTTSLTFPRSPSASARGLSSPKRWGVWSPSSAKQPPRIVGHRGSGADNAAEVSVAVVSGTATATVAATGGAAIGLANLTPTSSPSPAPSSSPAPSPAQAQALVSPSTMLARKMRRTHILENTLLSLTQAIKQGCEYVEFDCQLTRDGVPVIHHDWAVKLPMPQGTPSSVPPVRIPLTHLTAAQFLSLEPQYMLNDASTAESGIMRAADQVAAAALKLEGPPPERQRRGKSGQPKQQQENDGLSRQSSFRSCASGSSNSSSGAGDAAGAGAAANEQNHNQSFFQASPLTSPAGSIVSAGGNGAPSAAVAASALPPPLPLPLPLPPSAASILKENKRRAAALGLTSLSASVGPAGVNGGLNRTPSFPSASSSSSSVTSPLLNGAAASALAASSLANGVNSLINGGASDDALAASRLAVSYATGLRDRFLTLEQLLCSLPAEAGCNIEVKFPTAEEVVLYGLRQFERNYFTDRILDVVLGVEAEKAKTQKAAGGGGAGMRRIMFSSFDPDICLLLRRKQDLFPVFFLTEAGTPNTDENPSALADPRMNSLAAAVEFACGAGLFGIVTDVRPILAAPRIIRYIQEECGLMLASYGRKNNDLEAVRLQADNGIAVIITDHVAHVVSSLKKQQSRE